MQTRDLLAARHRSPIRIPSRPVVGVRTASSAAAAGAEWLGAYGEVMGPIVTDLEIRNDSSRRVDGRLAYAPQLLGRAGAAFSLDSGEVRELPDVTRRVLAPASAGTLGALVFDAAVGDADVSLMARTYAIEGAGAASAPSSPGGVLIGLGESDEAWTEIEVANQADRESRFSVRLRSASGAPLGESAVIALRGHETRTLALAEIFAGARGEILTAELVPLDGASLPDSRAIVVAGETGRLALPAQTTDVRLYLPVTGRAEGVSGTWLASDLALASAADRPTAVRARFVEANRDGSAAPTATVALAARESRRVVDVLAELFGLSEVSGVLELSADGPIAAATILATRAEDGTLGPARAAAPFVPAGFSRRTLLADSRTGAPTRLRLLNPGDEPLPVLLRWLDEDGRVARESAAVVPRAGLLDLDVPENTEPAAALRIDSDRPVFAWAGADRILPETGGIREPVRVAR